MVAAGIFTSLGGYPDRELQLSNAEIDVTGDLAGPETVGGIAVILKQPRNEHPFDLGPAAVIDDCDTLWGLHDLFDTASCGTVDLLRGVSIFDLLPYTTPEDIQTSGENLDFLGNRFKTCVEAVRYKKPDVVLCAGTFQLPKRWDKARCNRCKGEAWKLERRMVGYDFGGKSTIRLKNAHGECTRIHRVNTSHPSFSLNYHREYSCFVQLLLLAVSQACTVYRRTWVERTWMNDLRKLCMKQSSKLYPRDDQELCSNDENEEDDMNEDEPINLRYDSLLSRIRKTITSIASSRCDLYDGLLRSSLSRLLNDASLCLRFMPVECLTASQGP